MSVFLPSPRERGVGMKMGCRERQREKYTQRESESVVVKNMIPKLRLLV